MITLYGVQGPNVAKTRASLLHKGLAFENIGVDLLNQSDAFRRLTPIGKVPVIQDEGLVIHDSLFIAEYLDRKYPQSPKLLPEELPQRTKAYTIFALLDRIFTVASPIVAKRLGFFDVVEPIKAACSGYYPIDEKSGEELEVHFVDYIESLAASLNGENYFTGHSAMQADFAVFAFMNFYDQIGLDIGPMREWKNKRKSEFPFNEMFATDEVSVHRTI